MAIYHYRGQVISRSKGRSSVAAAAYRSGTRLVDRRTGLVHDYTRRRRTGIEAFIETPEGAPGWMRDREELWNGVEGKERRKDAQLAREFDLALPVELPAEDQKELVRGFVRGQFVDSGMVADVAIHRDKEGNPHAHVMLTMRSVGPEGFGNKVREWNRTDLLGRWREAWARDVNRGLERAGSDERVDHRSFKDRGIERDPTRHDGPHVREMEARGIRTDRGESNREVHRRNEERDREREHRQAEPGPLPGPRRERRPSRRGGPIRGPRRDEGDRDPDRDFF